MKPKRAEILDPVGPECPCELVYLWELFTEVSMGMSANGMTYPIITWECLAAWQGQMRVDLLPWESQVIVKLGNLRAAILSEDQGKGGK